MIRLDVRSNKNGQINDIGRPLRKQIKNFSTFAYVMAQSDFGCMKISDTGKQVTNSILLVTNYCRNESFYVITTAINNQKTMHANSVINELKTRK